MFNFSLKNKIIKNTLISNLIRKKFCENIPQEIIKPNFNILFFGNDEISLPSLERLNSIYKNNTESPIKKLTVVTTPNDNKKSTQGIFHKFLHTKNLELFYLDKKNLENSWRDLQKKILEEKFNMGLIASFGQMIPKEVIESLNEKVYVMHPSLLPKYRGGAPIQHTLLNKEKKTGITICEASIGRFDAGDIVIQKEVNVEIFHRFKELSFILSELGANAIGELIENYEDLIDKKIPQNDSDSTKAPLISSEIYLDFTKQKAEDICTNYKAFFGSQIEPYTKLLIKEKKRLMFFDNLFVVTKNSNQYTKILQGIDSKAKPGDIYWDLKLERNFVFIKTKENWIASNKVKLDGTNYLNTDFLITKIFMNKRFEEGKNNEILNFKTIGKK